MARKRFKFRIYDEKRQKMRLGNRIEGFLLELAMEI